jgi:hypothetical protein
LRLGFATTRHRETTKTSRSASTCNANGTTVYLADLENDSELLRSRPVRFLQDSMREHATCRRQLFRQIDSGSSVFCTLSYSSVDLSSPDSEYWFDLRPFIRPGIMLTASGPPASVIAQFRVARAKESACRARVADSLDSVRDGRASCTSRLRIRCKQSSRMRGRGCVPGALVLMERTPQCVWAASREGIINGTHEQGH